MKKMGSIPSMEPSESELFFTDLTIIEAEGKHEEVNRIMIEDMYDGYKWVINTSLTLLSMAGVANFNLDFYYDGKVIILDFEPSMPNLLYNPDLSFLSLWAQSNGWSVPEPHPDLIRTSIEFWKHFWETSIIQSSFLDNKFGAKTFE